MFLVHFELQIATENMISKWQSELQGIKSKYTSV